MVNNYHIINCHMKVSQYNVGSNKTLYCCFKDPTLVSGFGLMECPKLTACFLQHFNDFFIQLTTKVVLFFEKIKGCKFSIFARNL